MPRRLWFLEHAEYFSDYIGLFCGYVRLFWGYMGALLRYIGLFCAFTRLLCGYIRLFCGYIGLFCGYIGLFGGFGPEIHDSWSCYDSWKRRQKGKEKRKMIWMHIYVLFFSPFFFLLSRNHEKHPLQTDQFGPFWRGCKFHTPVSLRVWIAVYYIAVCYTYILEWIPMRALFESPMGWLRFVGSLKRQVSFTKYRSLL